MYNENFEKRLLNNKTMQKLSSLSVEDLEKRYTSKVESEFATYIIDEVSKVDEDGYHVNFNMYDLRGKNLTYMCEQLFPIASTLAENNLFINCEQLVSDIESMLREFEDDIEISMSAFTRHSDDPLEFVVLIINKIIDMLNSIIEKINTNKPEV